MKSVVSCSPERFKSSYYRIDSLTWEFDASERDEVLSLLIRCIAGLPEMQKKALAMYHSENLELSEIAMAIGLTEYETDQMLGRALAGLQAKLATELGLAGFHHRRAFTPAIELRDFPHGP
jgi:DNA-directed RNA polymerase specialized sigma24 family protein